MVQSIKRVVLFAPQNCTGNSGAVGDTILQTSFVRTLLDRSLFPDLKELHWWGTKWVVDDLFPDLAKSVVLHDWDGTKEQLIGNADYDGLATAIKSNRDSVAFVCTRGEDVIQKIEDDIGKETCFKPAKDLDAQSDTHLSRQLHSCLDRLGIYIPDFPEPRIVVTQAEINNAIEEMNRLREDPENKNRGKHDYKIGVDRVFLLHPGLQKNAQDRRTWNEDKWIELVRILGEVGVVIVACDARDSAKAEQDTAEDIAKADRIQTYNWRFVKKLGLKKLAAWACASTVCIARDSGPMHVAAAAIGPKERARVLGLFSVMCPDTWKPLSGNFKGLGQWPLPLDPYVRPDEVAVAATHWDP